MEFTWTVLSLSVAKRFQQSELLFLFGYLRVCLRDILVVELNHGYISLDTHAFPHF